MNGETRLSEMIRLHDELGSSTAVAKRLGVSTALVSHYMKVARRPDLVRLIEEGELTVEQAVNHVRKGTTATIIRPHISVPLIMILLPDGTRSEVMVGDDFSSATYEWNGRVISIAQKENVNG